MDTLLECVLEEGELASIHSQEEEVGRRQGEVSFLLARLSWWS